MPANVRQAPPVPVDRKRNIAMRRPYLLQHFMMYAVAGEVHDGPVPRNQTDRGAAACLDESPGERGV